MADFPLFAYTVADFTVTNGGVIPSSISDVNTTSPDADFTVTNGGVTDGVQWPAVQVLASVGNSAFFFRGPRSGRVLELTANQSAVITIFMQDIETGQGLAGLVATMAVQLKKSAGAFASASPTVTDRSFGWYDLAFLGASFDTLGEGALHVTAPGAQPNDETVFKVIAINKDDAVRGGMSALPNVAAGALGGLPMNAVRTNTAQGAGNGVNQIVLDAGASSTDGFYSRDTVTIVAGTGAGQGRFIASYAGSTKTASVNKNWSTQPDNTSVFAIVSASNNLLTEGLAQGGTANTLTFRANDSTQDDLYKNEWVQITSGTGAGQTRLIIGYVGSTKVATVDLNWKINPDATSVYQILTGSTVPPVTGVALTTDITASTATLAADITASTTTILAAIPSAAGFRDAVLDAVRSGHVTVGSIGEAISLAASLLQGNFFIDNTDNTSPNGQTAARLRCFHTGTAAGAATLGGSGEGEFATFVVTTTYTGPNKINTHRVVQQ